MGWALTKALLILYDHRMVRNKNIRNSTVTDQSDAVLHQRLLVYNRSAKNGLFSDVCVSKRFIAQVQQALAAIISIAIILQSITGFPSGPSRSQACSQLAEFGPRSTGPHAVGEAGREPGGGRRRPQWAHGSTVCIALKLQRRWWRCGACWGC